MVYSHILSTQLVCRFVVTEPVNINHKHPLEVLVVSLGVFHFSDKDTLDSYIFSKVGCSFGMPSTLGRSLLGLKRTCVLG